MKRKVIGTDDVAGATVVRVDHDEVVLDLDGRKLILELEYSSDYHSMCEGTCSCCYGSGYDSAYLVAREEV
jgi:hypothetical protein